VRHGTVYIYTYGTHREEHDMYKTASAWHAQGEQLMDALLEDDQEKTAVLGLVSGPVGNYYG